MRAQAKSSIEDPSPLTTQQFTKVEQEEGVCSLDKLAMATKQYLWLRIIIINMKQIRKTKKGQHYSFYYYIIFGGLF